VFAPVALPVIPPKEQAVFEQVLTALADDFDPDAYTSAKRAGLRNLIAAKQGTGGTLSVPAAVKQTVATTTLTDQLAAVLAMAKAAKAPKKATKTAKKTA